MGPRRFELTSESGVTVLLCDLGATLMGARAPDRRGELGDVVLGSDDPRAYLAPHPSFGSTVGRVANRISGARFPLTGRTVSLEANDGPHHLHGGPGGFATRAWRAEGLPEKPASRGAGVRFSRESPDGEEGYPGRLRVSVTYTLDALGELLMDYRATTDRTTVVSLTNHAYFNLHDGGASPVLDHQLTLAASHYLPLRSDGIPTGEVVPVEGTPFDFRAPRRLGAAIDAIGDGRGGYDHPFALDASARSTAGEPVAARLRAVARLYDPATGRQLHVATSLPGLQLYSGNGLDGNFVGRGGLAYGRRSGLCLEAQLWPDAPNQPGFPSMLLEPGDEWRHAISYRFSVATPEGAGRG